MTKIAAATVLAFAATGVQAVDIIAPSSFVMSANAGLDTAGVVPGGIPVGLDTTIAGFVDTTAGTWGVSSTTPFFGGIWTASNGQLIAAAGSYSLNTASGAVTTGSGNCGTGFMCFDVGAGQMAGTIDFAWGATTGIRVVNVWNVTSDAFNTTYTAAVVPGMENGPFLGYNAQFNMTAPVPEASTYGMMLAGLGLVGFAVRRRKLMAA